MTTKPAEPRTLFDEEDTGEVELIPAEEATMALRERPASGEPMMMALARMEHGLQVLDKAHKILKSIRASALSLTGHADWVAMKGRGAPDEDAFCMLASSGAEKMRQFFMIDMDPAQPTDASGAFAPEVERGEGDEIQLHGWAMGRSRLTGETIRVSMSRSSSEDFTGRTAAIGATALVAKADLARSLETGLKTKLVRELAGMKKVPIAELADAGIKVSQIPRGSGFGRSAERGAEGVTSEDVKAAAKNLGDEILRRVGGDKGAAADLLVDITKNPPKFGGSRSISQLTQDWQVERAWEKLKAHEVFGDKAAQGGGAE